MSFAFQQWLPIPTK
jgi:hypothetical protein